MSYVMFDPSKLNALGKFQGTMAGIQAGSAEYLGVAMAPTTVLNQGGYYAMQDTSTGSIHLEKLHNDSLFTNQWYDQGTKTQFNTSSTAKTFDLSSLSNNMTAAEIAALDN